MIRKKFTLLFSLSAILVLVLVTRTIMLKPVEIESGPNNIKLAKININRAAQNLSKVIQFETIATLDNNLENAQSFIGLHKYLRESYKDIFTKLEVKQFPPFGLLIKWQGKNPQLKPILFMAHQDVVPVAPGTLDKWKHPPFSGKIDEGYIYGRGSMDDKGSLIAILEAADTLMKAGHAPERTIYILSTDNEEIGGSTAAAVAKYFANNKIHLEAVLDEGGFILSDQFNQVSSPVALIGISEKGYMDLELVASAKGGHSSMPEQQTTIGILSKAIVQLEENQLPTHISDVQQEMLENIGSHMNFKDRLIVANLWLFRPLLAWQLTQNPATNAGIRTTTAVTIFNAGIKANVLPAEAKTIVNFRIITGESTASVIEHVRKTISDPRITINPLIRQEPSPFSSYSNKVYSTIEMGIKAIYADKKPIVTPFILVGTTDSRYFVDVSDNQYRFLSCLISKQELSGFHGYNEKLSVNNLEKMIQFYIILMQELGYFLHKPLQ